MAAKPKGFYTKETKKKAPAKKKKTEIKNPCEHCGLHKETEVQLKGAGKKGILIITDHPTKKEAETKDPLAGNAGRILREQLKECEINLNVDCWRICAVRCKPTKGDPTTKQINSCRVHLLKTIEKLQPDKIIVCGKVAFQTLIGHRTSVTGITKFAGHSIPDQELQAWVFPTFGLVHLLSKEDEVPLHNAFNKHIKKACEYPAAFLNYSTDKEKVELITNSMGAIIYLQGLSPKDTIAFDIETSGLKPYREGHFIRTIAICNSEHKAVAFPVFEDAQFKKELKKVMRNPEIKKVAHNLKFENVWMRKILNIQINNWYFDTMIAAHILDNRTGVTKLKFQTHANFGVVGYDKEIEKYLKSESKNANDFNTISEAPLEDLLLYNGLDALYTYRLYQKQIREMDAEDFAAYDFFHSGLLALAEVEMNGVNSNQNYYATQFKHLTRQIEKLHVQIMNSPEVQKWNQIDPEKWKGKPFKYTSDQQLRYLLFTILKYTPVKETKGGNISVDAESLEKLTPTPFIKKLLQKRKLMKIRDTYLLGFIREGESGIIHPVFNLNSTVSYRSSSSNPNFQNVPKREELPQRLTRTGIIPSPGNQIMEVDYSGIEVGISACYHKDPVMIKYIEDPETDMHRDSAMNLFKMKKESITKERRQLAKNSFVFPEFYGSYYKECAKNLWEKMDDDTKKHLQSKGITSYMLYEKHVKKVEDNFWNERFKIYTRWKEKMWKLYQKNGKIISHTCFKYTGIMDKKEVSNYPIQGSAFHCLLWSLIQINKYLKEGKYKTKIIGQIHDSIIFDFCPDEKEKLFPAIRQIMTEDIKEHFKWIIVPLDVEAEISEIDGNWYEMQGVKI